MKEGDELVYIGSGGGGRSHVIKDIIILMNEGTRHVRTLRHRFSPKTYMAVIGEYNIDTIDGFSPVISMTDAEYAKFLLKWI